MTRTTPELAPPSPNFRATPAGGRLATTYDLACNRPHTRRIFSGIGFRTCDPITHRMQLLRCFWLETHYLKSTVLLSEDKRTFDELTTQLCTQERENKEEKLKGDVQSQEALEATKTKTLYKSKKQIGKCNYCHQNGHWVKSFRKWIADGKPAKPNQNDEFRRKDDVTANMSLLALHEEAFSSEEGCYDWFVDNGASKHITNNSNYFPSLKYLNPHMELLLQMVKSYQL
ncbi:hypothetical protein AVEN_153129-1 [Araneus ventricosus]|uniref:Uncharacterized protein n=1 Tax=Araneus ventricosus TaxID=182803 RepID=A0A4Y2IH69_ARAVE|nr:hypothetical protein AVEN_153129-1 [Araneus ventricosus]